MNEEIVKRPVQKRKRMLNLIDVLLIVLVVAALGVFLSYRFFLAGDTVQTVTLQYSIEFNCVSAQVESQGLLSDELYDGEGVCYGTVSKCSETETRKHMLSAGAELEQAQSVYCMTATVQCEAIRTKDGKYLIGGKELSVGDQLSLHSNDFVVNGACTEIAEVPNE